MTTPWGKRWYKHSTKLTVPEQILVDLREGSCDGIEIKTFLYPFETTNLPHRSGTSLTQRRANCNRRPPTLKSEGTHSLERSLWGRLGVFCVLSLVPKEREEFRLSSRSLVGAMI